MSEANDETAPSAALVEANTDVDHGATEVNERTENGNKFQQAVAAWRTLDLTKMVSSLDTAAADMVNQQKESMVQRKDLAQKTKGFRKLDDAAKLVEIKDLLKAYQGYVDMLTNQNKAVSSAFMQAYSPLSEAPDPYPLLEASIDALITADELVPKLEADNEGLNKQVSTLTEQLEQTEKRLEEERAKRQSFEGAQDTRIQDVESSWKAVLQEKEDNWAAKERSLDDKIENQERLLKELKANYEVSQRLERSGEEAQDTGRSRAIAAELEIANSELDRSNVRLAEVEARNEQLRVELAQITSQSRKETAVEDDPAFLRLQSENSSLLRRLDAARYTKDAEKKNLESKLRTTEKDLTALRTDCEALKTKVQKWGNYDEIKQELEMLRAIEFAGLEPDNVPNGKQDEAGGENADVGVGESLEQLLVTRNKKLSNELTELRMSHQELQQRLTQLQEDSSEANSELDKVRILNATLENDLQKTQQEIANAFETMSVAGTHYSRYPKSVYGSRKGGNPSPTSSIIGGFDSGSPRTTLEALRAGEATGPGSGILPMVTAQRDRFKKKITELEQELQKQYQMVSSLRTEVSSLQKDNLNLYEKTRYVSTYNRGQPATSGAAYGANPNPSSVPITNDGPMSPGSPIDRYRSAYESNISPFAAFRGRESARAMKRMSLPERAVFQVTRMVLATRTSRNLFALYCVVLHILIFSMLFFSGSDELQRQAGAVAAGSVAAAARGASNGRAAADVDG